MSTWTANDIPDLTDNVAIVTGANSGLGYETSLALARKNATVVLACRNLDKGEQAKQAILEHVPNAKLEVRSLDLASLASIRRFAEGVSADYDRLDMLINNAGMIQPARRETEDGLELQFGVNHLGHFALTGLVLDKLLSTPDSRVVNVSSGAHRMNPRINFDDLMGEQEYDRWKAYGQSKFANILFTVELQRRLAKKHEHSCKAVAAHPGLSVTKFQPNATETAQTSWLERVFLNNLTPLLGQSAAQGALPQLYAATVEAVNGGDYYGPKWLKMRGEPVLETPHENVHDEAMAVRFWEVSAELSGVTYDALN
jgi:NAD(P)-dependent dehydrogenase (short-subunit alcohol dehydrogenase family)